MNARVEQNWMYSFGKCVRIAPVLLIFSFFDDRLKKADNSSNANGSKISLYS